MPTGTGLDHHSGFRENWLARCALFHCETKTARYFGQMKFAPKSQVSRFIYQKLEIIKCLLMITGY